MDAVVLYPHLAPEVRQQQREEQSPPAVTQCLPTADNSTCVSQKQDQSQRPSGVEVRQRLFRNRMLLPDSSQKMSKSFRNRFFATRTFSGASDPAPSAPLP